MKEAKTNLLIPVDFRIFCLKAIEYAMKLSEVSQGKIYLLHVIESESWWDDQFNAEKITRSAYEKLELLKKEQHLPENTDLKVIQGKRHQEIIAYSEHINARYIILADNYPLTSGNIRLGSTLSQVITLAPRPVISITNREERIFKNIAVPLDLNQTSRLQLFNSVAMALQHQSKIHLISVLFGETDLRSSRINQKIEKYKKTYEENGIDFTVKLLVKGKDLAYKSILKYCEEQKVDSILIMTHSEIAKFDNYLGAFAHHIINEATMPVISINNTSAQYNEAHITHSFVDPLGVFSSK